MHKYHKKFLDQTMGLGLPVNTAGYAEDELLFIEQFVVEYAAHGLDLAKEMDGGRLPVLIRGHTILIARSDAENWYNKYFDLLMSRLLRDDPACKAFPAASISTR